MTRWMVQQVNTGHKAKAEFSLRFTRMGLAALSAYPPAKSRASFSVTNSGGSLNTMVPAKLLSLS